MKATSLRIHTCISNIHNFHAPVRMNNGLLLLLLLALSPLGMMAQPLTGKVTDASDKPVGSVSVTLQGSGGRVVAFSRTAEDGTFSIKLPGDRSVEHISFRRMGFAEVRMPVGEFASGQTVRMTEEGVGLREVKVTSQRIRQDNDTLVFSVAGFRQRQDRSIADVIRKMPGLDVRSDGKITYQGKAINEFTIEGMDLTNGRYAQISENLSADKVKSVEVRENNQPKKVLRDVQFSEQAALNLVLRDDARNVWQGLCDMASGLTLQDGTRWLRDTRLMGMVFGRKCQSVSIWKTNNTGKDIQTEVSDLIFDSNALSPLTTRLSGIGVASADIDGRRYAFNDSQLAATNWLFRTRGGHDLRLQASCFLDRTESERFSETTYNDITGGWSLREDASTSSHTSKWDVEMQYKVNSESMYLNNRLEANIGLGRSSGLSSLNGSLTHEDVRPRSCFVSDAVEMIRKMGNGNSYTLSSAIAYDRLPGRILLCDSTAEKLDMTALRWNARANFRHRLWRWSVAWNIGLDMTLNRMDIENPLASQKGVRYDEERLYAFPCLSLDHGRLRVSASPRMSLLRRRYGAARAGDFLFEPSVSVSYKQNASLDYGAACLMSCMADGMNEACDIPVFTSYRTMTLGSGGLDRSRTHNASAYARYHHIMHGLFANVGASYHSVRHARMYESSVEGLFFRQHASGMHDNTVGWSLSCDVSKSFSWAKAVIKAGCEWNTDDYHILLDGEPVPCNMRGFLASVGFSLKPFPLLSIEEKSRFSHSRQRSSRAGGGPEHSMNHFEHHIKIFVLLGKWQLEIDNELYHSNDRSVSFSHFADMALSYRTRKMELGIWLNNVMGSDKYERRYVTTTQSVHAVIRLRPREMMARILFNI